MKKIVAALITVLIVSLSTVCICYAGDIPEGFLSDDSSQLYFGKVTAVSSDTVTIIPLKNIKGDAVLNTPVTYKKGYMMGGGNHQIGKTYLFGYTAGNDLYCWVTDSTDPKTLKIKNASAMDLRLQKYLNNGDIAKAEEGRLKKAAAESPGPSPFTAPSLSPTQSLSVSDLPQPVSAVGAGKDAHSMMPLIILLIAVFVGLVAVWLLVTKRKVNRR
jgi:hypothetical protein